jgi:Flp pilus assembly protein TadD
MTIVEVVIMKIYLILIIVTASFVPNALAAGSSTYTTSISEDVEVYNKGVESMRNKQFAKAEKQFRKALTKNDELAEAHNNLAYTLRKQGPENYDEALTHYNRAIELNPDLPEPYMYRGVLHVQMNNKELALKDHKTLLELGSPLAEALEYVVTNGIEKDPEQFFGVSGKLGG